MKDGEFKSYDTSTTEALGAMCKGCGHRGGRHRQATPWQPACPGEEYDPADLAIAEVAGLPEPS